MSSRPVSIAKIVAICIAFALVAVASLLAALDPGKVVSGALKGEAFYKGRPTSFWMDEIQQGLKTGASFGKIWGPLSKPEAVPILVLCLDSRNVAIRHGGAAMLLRMPPVPLAYDAFLAHLDDPDASIRDSAMLGLAKFRSKAKGAVQRLSVIAQSGNEVARGIARYALWEIDPEATRPIEGWRQFSSKEFGFTAQFPGQVEHNQSTLATASGDIPKNAFEADSGFCHYVIAISQISPDVSASVDDWGVWMEDLARQRADYMGGELVSFTMLNVQGLTGYESIEQIPPAGNRQFTTELRTRQFIVADLAYQATVAYPEKNFMSPKAAEYFFSSFSLPSQGH